MSTRIKWFIGIGCILSLLGIVAPIFFYVKDFHELPRSSNPSDWGTFGDFFGGILNPIISLLTLIVTTIIAFNISRIERRNHDESVHNPVKPLLTIGTGYFYSSDISRVGLTIEKDSYDYTPPKTPVNPYDVLNLSKQFYLKVSNKGLGIANEVRVTFDVNLDNLKKTLLIDHPKIKVTAADVKTEDDGRTFVVLGIKSEPQYFNYFGSSKIWGKEQSGHGIINTDEEVMVGIPSPIMNAFKLYNLNRRLENRHDEFPTINVMFTFKNIHDKILTSKFQVALLHVHDYHNFSIFRIVI